MGRRPRHEQPERVPPGSGGRKPPDLSADTAAAKAAAHELHVLLSGAKTVIGDLEQARNSLEARITGLTESVTRDVAGSVDTWLSEQIREIDAAIKPALLKFQKTAAEFAGAESPEDFAIHVVRGITGELRPRIDRLVEARLDQWEEVLLGQELKTSRSRVKDALADWNKGERRRT